MNKIENSVTVNGQKVQVAENFAESQKPEVDFCYYYAETQTSWKVVEVTAKLIIIQNFETRTKVEKSLPDFLNAVKEGILLPLYYQNRMVKAMRKKEE